MDDSNDAKAFIERLRERSLNATGRSRHRPAFVAVKPLVSQALQAGFTLKAIWQQLRDDDKIAMSYEAFRIHCKNAELRRARSGSTTPANTDTNSSAPRRFRHNAIPDLKKLYGDG